MKIKNILCSLMLVPACLYAKTNTLPDKTVGIVLPMDHVALRAIVQGFETSLNKSYAGHIHYEVDNAQNDINLQHAIIQKFINEKVDMIVPVATGTTEMTLGMVKQIPVISLAADFSEQQRLARQPRNTTGVHDELNDATEMNFLSAAIPNLKKFTLIYSDSDKVIPEVNEIIKINQAKGITVQKLMIQNLSDLYTLSQYIDGDSQAIYILKDNLVASGISTLIQVAEKKHLPLITSDQGTVSQGACAALGVYESQIGEMGGKIAAEVFQGKSIATIPMQDLTNYAVFINRDACQKLGVNLDLLTSYAKIQNDQVAYLN